MPNDECASKRRTVLNGRTDSWTELSWVEAKAKAWNELKLWKPTDTEIHFSFSAKSKDGQSLGVAMGCWLKCEHKLGTRWDQAFAYLFMSLLVCCSWSNKKRHSSNNNNNENNINTSSSTRKRGRDYKRKINRKKKQQQQTCYWFQLLLSLLLYLLLLLLSLSLSCRCWRGQNSKETSAQHFSVCSKI